MGRLLHVRMTLFMIICVHKVIDEAHQFLAVTHAVYIDTLMPFDLASRN